MPCDAGETRGECVIKSKKRTKTTRSGAAKHTVPVHPGPCTLRFADGKLHGVLANGTSAVGIVLLWNGVVVDEGQVGEGGQFSLSLPPHSLTGTADVLSSDTGISLLDRAVSFDFGVRIRWNGWSYSDRAFTGSFAVADHPSAASPRRLLVQGIDGDTVYMQTFAVAGEDGVYRFGSPLRRLVGLGGQARISPCIAGVLLPETLDLTAEQIGVLGHLDTVDETLVRGWAVDLQEPSRRLSVELRVPGSPLVTGAAANVRPDLRDIGVSDGQSGFGLTLPPLTTGGGSRAVHAYLAGTDLELVNSPAFLPDVPTILGAFDAVEGPFAGGWAINMLDSGKPMDLEAICGGEVIGSGSTTLYRGDVEASGMPTAWCGFRFLLDRPLPTLYDKDIVVRVVGTDTQIAGSPRRITQNGNIKRFLTRSSLPTSVLRRLITRMTRQTEGLIVSIVMPVYNPPAEWLLEALNSVLAQWSGNWELVCIDDASPQKHVAQILFAAARHDPRIRVITLPENGGIAAATNAGIAAATGDYIAFMDHDDVIEPDAIHKLALAAKTTGADFIYSDEAITTDDINSIIEVRARPAFSHDYYLSHPYFVHMICIRAELARRLGGWDQSLDISADVDFVLRAIENADAIAHVPSVLYRWRTHETSTGHAKMAQVTATMVDLLGRHLARMERPATVRPGFRYNEYRVDWADDGGEILIVIPTKNRVDLLQTCISSIERTSEGANYRIVVIDHESTDPETVAYLKSMTPRHTVMPYSGVFNYALMNNLAVRTHGGDSKYILFLNNDVEAIEDGWLQRMRSLAARPEVGAVGPLLLYGDDRVQHAGVLMSFSGAADHAMKFHAAYLSKGNRHPGYNCNLTSVRDYSAVTAACLMTSAAVFRQIGGFDEDFVVGFNDTDLCLRIVAAGYKVLYDGFSVLYHHESATRTQSNAVSHPEDDARLRARWANYFQQGDPFYSPLLAPRGTDHILRQDSGCKGMMAARVVRTGPPPPVAKPTPVKKPTRRRAKTPARA